jgi:predicted NAD/FAD-binding protein
LHRHTDRVDLRHADGALESYDQVILACHSDQALALLVDADPEEREALTAIPYQANEVVLHTDERLLPRSRLAWSSWNYWLRQRYQQQAVLTYNMNILQGIESPTTFCVTLNASEEIAPERIIGRYNYSHPVFSLQSVQAVERIAEFNGRRRTWFAGAWLGNGFHEDGVVSAKQVVQGIDRLAGESLQQVEPARLAHA